MLRFPFSNRLLVLLIGLLGVAGLPVTADHEQEPEESFHLGVNQQAHGAMPVEGMRHYYEVAVGTGGSGLGHANLVVTLEEWSGAGNMDLFIGFEEKPDHRACDSPTCLSADGADRACILLPDPGTYHVLVYGRSLAALPAGYTVSVRADAPLADPGRGCTLLGVP